MLNKREFRKIATKNHLLKDIDAFKPKENVDATMNKDRIMGTSKTHFVLDFLSRIIASSF